MPLYAWGANSYGQLGLGNKVDSVLEPTEVKLENSGLKAENIVEISGGAGHTLILDTNGHVYCCGWNSKGQLGISEDTIKFKQIEILAGYKIVHISCGWDFSAALTGCGKLFVWGNNAYLQLGLSKSITCTGIPSRLHVSQKIATGFTRVSCGMRHTAMLTKDGGVVVAGTGAKGALGIGDNYNDDAYMSISKVPDLEDARSVAGGQNHTVCLKNDGTVLSWGENKQGQLGLDPATSNFFVPTEVFTHEGLEKVEAGWTHTSVLTKTGEIYNWGRNNYGQLGSQRQVLHKPEKLAGISGIQQLTSGSEHNLAVNGDGQLFVWGWNEHGSCGTGDANNVMKPRQILTNRTVKLAFACTGQSFAVVE